MKRKGKNVSDNRLLFAIPLVLVAIAAIFMAGMKAGRPGTDLPVATPQETVSPTAGPTPTQTPTPTAAPAPQKAETQPVVTTGCAQFKPENGQVFMRVTLAPKSGVMTGKTVVRVKPTGSCPNESGAVEHWLNENELSWTSPSLNPGRYRIEIANGNYNGVIAETHDLVEGGYEYTIQTD